MSITDRLNQTLNIMPDEEDEKDLPMIIDEIDNLDLKSHKSQDIELARSTIVNLINKSVDLLDDVINLAKESESPRNIEVTSNLIKTTADLSKNLMDIHKTSSKETPSDQPGEQNNTQNNYYVGTTADLQKLIQEQSGGSDE